MKKAFPSLLLTLALALSACGQNATPTVQSTAVLPTPVVMVTPAAATTLPTPVVMVTPAAATAAVPLTASGQAVSVFGIHFVIPPGLGAGVNAESVAEMPATADSPYWAVAPAHYRLTLQGYPLTPQFINTPVVLVYPAAEYAAMQPVAADNLAKLRAILATPAAPLTYEALPWVPFFNATLALAANRQVVNFQGGSGVRMVAHYAQAAMPFSNQELSYHYHGLSADGKYYVLVIVPITAPTSEFPSLPRDFDSTQYQSYVEQVTTVLASAEFNPTLAQLDALVQSIQLDAPVIAPQTTTSPTPCTPDVAAYVRDVTVPDGTVFKPGEKFSKSWEIKNAGGCVWNPSYKLVFQSGDPLGNAREFPLTAGNDVSPGAVFQPVFEFQAPTQPGSYRSYWSIANGAGQIISGEKHITNTFFVDIQVALTATVTSAAGTPSAGATATPATSASLAKPQMENYSYSCTTSTVTVILNWLDKSDNETGFRIYRNDSLIATLPANTLTYTDNVALSPGSALTYKLVAYNSSGESGSANTSFTPNCQ